MTEEQILKEFDNYREQLAQSKLSDIRFKAASAAITGCKLIIKKLAKAAST